VRYRRFWARGRTPATPPMTPPCSWCPRGSPTSSSPSASLAPAELRRSLQW
jgi:hypothetical protein